MDCILHRLACFLARVPFSRGLLAIKYSPMVKAVGVINVESAGFKHILLHTSCSKYEL